MQLALALPLLLAVQAPVETEPTWDVSLGFGSHSFDEAALDAGGSLELQRTGVSVGLSRPLDERRRLGIGVRYEASVYDFVGGTAANQLLFGLNGGPAAVDSLQRYGLGASLTTRIDEERSWTLQGYANVGQESGASLGGSTTYGLGAHYAFPWKDRIELSVGGFASTRLDDGLLVYPWFTLDWYPTERLHVGSEGGGEGVGYDWLDDLRVYASASFSERNYRFDDASILRDDQLALNLGLVWAVSDSVELELFGGWAARSMTLTPSGAAFDNGDDAETVPFLGLDLRFAP